MSSNAIKVLRNETSEPNQVTVKDTEESYSEASKDFINDLVAHQILEPVNPIKEERSAYDTTSKNMSSSRGS